LKKLDVALTACIINIINGADRSNTIWITSLDEGHMPESFSLKFEDYSYHHGMWNAWKDLKTKWVYTIEGEEKQIYDEYLFKQTDFSRFPLEVQDAYRASPRYVCSFTFSSFGGLQTIGEEPLSEANMDILARFGKVFDLTYTRFNDLKQAEIRELEAIKESSLDRLRAEIASMRTAEDLEGIPPLIWRELTTSGLYSSSDVIQIVFDRSAPLMILIMQAVSA